MVTLQRLPTIDIFNSSSVMTDNEIAPIAAALQVQVSRDLAPLWRIDAVVTFVPKTSKPNPMHWWVVVVDDTDHAGALGFHDITPAGLPQAKIFARTILKEKLSVSSTMSHEILEMLADPWGNLLTFDITRASRIDRLYTREICGAVEEQSLGYTIAVDCPFTKKTHIVIVSDFVTPNWFMPGFPADKYDFMDHLEGPMPTLAPGGYIGYYDLVTRQWARLVAEPISRPRGRPRKRKADKESSP